MTIKNFTLYSARVFKKAIAFIFSVCPDPGVFYEMIWGMNYTAVDLYLSEKGQRIVANLLTDNKKEQGGTKI